MANLRLKIHNCCREARRELLCASRQADRRSRRARVVMELLYASRQSASDVLRARLNLLGYFCSRMHRYGPVRSGTPQARIGYFFGPICIGNPIVNSKRLWAAPQPNRDRFEIEKLRQLPRGTPGAALCLSADRPPLASSPGGHGVALCLSAEC